MLSELILAATPIERVERPGRDPGISMSGLFPCAYRMYKVQVGEFWDEKLEPQQVLNMEDGATQELQAIDRLRRAGIKVYFRKQLVTVGRSKIAGEPDGKFKLREQEYLWEFKAMNLERYNEFVRWGLRTFPNYKAQVQGYLLGAGLDMACVQAKHKDSNNYNDIIEHLDKDFILPIVEWCDKIKLESWIPEPVQCKYCAYCGMDCFGKALDLSWMDSVDELEMAQRWIKGKLFKDGGEAMIEEARDFFIGVKDKYGNWIKRGLIGDKDQLTASGIEIKKSTQHRLDVNRNKLVEEFGVEGLMKVSEEKTIDQYRIREVR